MKPFPVVEETRGNPIVATQIEKAMLAVQDEICGEIESELGSLTNNDQFLPSLKKARLKSQIYLELLLYDGPQKGALSAFHLDLPDPFSYFAGFFELNLYQIPTLLHRSEVFFYYDFTVGNWAFRTKPEAPLQFSYSVSERKLKANWTTPLSCVTPWHLLQFKNMRFIAR